MGKRVGNWMLTYSGKKFYPLDPHADEICIEDIAHALSMICRYNGHSRKFYSVAEHCTIMSLDGFPGDPRWRLMHDATEAYICDVIRPLKSSLMGYDHIEWRLREIIGQR